MRTFVNIILIALLSWVAAFYLMWWQVILCAFLVTLVRPLKPGWAFLSGFAAIALLWGAAAGWIDHQTNAILSKKIAALFQLPHHSLMVLVTAVVGGIAGGMGALSGTYVRKLFR